MLTNILEVFSNWLLEYVWRDWTGSRGLGAPCRPEPEMLAFSLRPGTVPSYQDQHVACDTAGGQRAALNYQVTNEHRWVGGLRQPRLHLLHSGKPQVGNQDVGQSCTPASSVVAHMSCPSVLVTWGPPYPVLALSQPAYICKDPLSK